MAEIVNLNQFRKKKARTERKVQASENVAKFGRTKSDRKADKQRTDKSRKDLDGHKLDDDTV